MSTATPVLPPAAPPAVAARRGSAIWVGVAAVVALEVPYPLLSGSARDVLTVLTVVGFAAVSLAHALVALGRRYAVTLVAVAAGGGFVAELIGVHTGVPFGSYTYGHGLGPRLAGVPLVIPLAWLMMAHPAAEVARRLTARRLAGVALGAWALACWDLFLDPQMVSAGQWQWHGVGVHLPGVADVPLSNVGGWLLVSLLVMAVLVPAGRGIPHDDRPALALWLWSVMSSTLAAAAFEGRPAVAAWGALAAAVVAVPLLRQPGVLGVTTPR